MHLGRKKIVKYLLYVSMGIVIKWLSPVINESNAVYVTDSKDSTTKTNSNCGHMRDEDIWKKVSYSGSVQLADRQETTNFLGLTKPISSLELGHDLAIRSSTQKILFNVSLFWDRFGKRVKTVIKWEVLLCNHLSDLSV